MNRARRTFLQVAASGVALVGAAAALAAGIPSGEESPRLTLRSDGSVSIADSLSGEAIVTADGLYPGASAGGTVTISNTGTSPGSLAVRFQHLEDTLGSNGGVLSDALDLEITDITDGSAGPVFAGSLAEMPPQDLLVLPPGGERTYRFVITMEDGGVPSTDYSGDNRLQLATSRFAYEWTLTDNGEDPGPCSGLIRGDNHRNRLVGTALGDKITAMGGSDWIKALAGDDCIDGGKGGDTIRTGPGDDQVLARQGMDVVRGGPGADMIRGGSGADRLAGGPGEDALYGGSGADRLVVRGGGTDFVDCGSGADYVIADEDDRIRHCGRRLGRSPTS